MNALKYHRLLKNYTMKAIAGKVGISPSLYSDIENGQVSAKSEVVDRLCEVLEAPKEVIFFPVRFGISEHKHREGEYGEVSNS